MKRYIRSSAYSKGGTGNPDEWDMVVVRQPGQPKLARKIYPGLQWDMNGHVFEVLHRNDMNSTAEVAEEWISEDTGKEMRQVSIWRIVSDNRSEFICPKNNINYRLHAVDADNSAEVREHEDSLAGQDDAEKKLKREYNDEYEDWDDEDYTPSASHGDYSPSNPWDAPGMSIHDFI